MTQRYQNVHTGEVVTLLDTEFVKSHPDGVVVYILEDGRRWNEDFFTKHWTPLVEDPEQDDEMPGEYGICR